MDLSPNFTLEELIYSEKARARKIVNEPNADELRNLVDLCGVVLEPARVLCGPLVVNSGFRCDTLNLVVTKGKNTRAHPEGRAADVVPMKMKLKDAFDLIRKSDIQFDQVILEPTWIHLGIARPGVAPRRMALFTPDGKNYTRVTG